MNLKLVIEDPLACNYNINAVDDIDNCIYVDNNCDICSGENNGYGTVIDNDDDNDGICNIDEKFVCMMKMLVIMMNCEQMITVVHTKVFMKNALMA